MVKGGKGGEGEEGRDRGGGIEGIGGVKQRKNVAIENKKQSEGGVRPKKKTMRGMGGRRNGEGRS